MKTLMKIGVVGGGGWLGQAIIKALLDAGTVTPAELGLSYRNKAPDTNPGLFVTQDSQELADASDVIIMSVRPADWPAVIISAKGKLVISVMAGITLQQLVDQTHTARVVRALPNVAAQIRKSYTPWVASAEATPEDRVIVARIFGACGACDEVGAESHIDYLTGLTGAGPAYPALLAQALMADAISHGIQPDTAQRAVTELLIGTGRLLEASRQNPADIVQEFVDYRGVIAAAINAMREAGFDAAVGKGLAAALQKSLTIGK